MTPAETIDIAYTQRMVAQYVSNAYYPGADTSSGSDLQHDLASGAEFVRSV
jgi:hypothetical protein